MVLPLTDRHIPNPSVSQLFSLFRNQQQQQPTNENMIQRQNAEHLTVQIREVMKMLLQILTFNFQVIGAFLGGKFKFGLIDTFGDFTVSLWAVLIHIGLGQHFVFTICKSRDIIAESNSLIEVLLLLVCFAFPSILMLCTLTSYKKTFGFVLSILWLAGLFKVCFPIFVEHIIHGNGIQRFWDWIRGKTVGFYLASIIVIACIINIVIYCVTLYGEPSKSKPPF
jgi:hypothetical protein